MLPMALFPEPSSPTEASRSGAKRLFGRWWRSQSPARQDRFATLATILFEQAQLASGDELEDPAAYVQRLNRLLLELSGG